VKGPNWPRGGWIGLFAKPETHKLEFTKVKYQTGSSGGLDRKFRSGGPKLPVQTFRTSGALNKLQNQSESSWNFQIQVLPHPPRGCWWVCWTPQGLAPHQTVDRDLPPKKLGVERKNNKNTSTKGTRCYRHIKISYFYWGSAIPTKEFLRPRCWGDHEGPTTKVSSLKQPRRLAWDFH
jgi:hypothetical protein